MQTRRRWKPLPDADLRAIRDDTERDVPHGDYCAAHVYRLASEVAEYRARFGPISDADADDTPDEDDGDPERIA